MCNDTELELWTNEHQPIFQKESGGVDYTPSYTDWYQKFSYYVYKNNQIIKAVYINIDLGMKEYINYYVISKGKFYDETQEIYSDDDSENEYYENIILPLHDFYNPNNNIYEGDWKYVQKK